MSTKYMEIVNTRILLCSCRVRKYPGWAWFPTALVSSRLKGVPRELAAIGAANIQLSNN
jgi:hypothetical protein